ncbi:MAG: helix-turn-helix domain-containing protein [Nitrospirota bacterium]
MVEIERDHICQALEKTGWRIEGKKGAAAMLGLNPSTLRGRMRKDGIRRS